MPEDRAVSLLLLGLYLSPPHLKTYVCPRLEHLGAERYGEECLPADKRWLVGRTGRERKETGIDKLRGGSEKRQEDGD